MTELLQAMTDLCQLLGGGLVQIGKSLGQGIVAMIKYLMFNVDATTGAITTINEFAGVMFIIAGISIALGIFYKLYIAITSAGRNK